MKNSITEIKEQIKRLKEEIKILEKGISFKDIYGKLYWVDYYLRSDCNTYQARINTERSLIGKMVKLNIIKNLFESEMLTGFYEVKAVKRKGRLVQGRINIPSELQKKIKNNAIKIILE